MTIHFVKPDHVAVHLRRRRELTLIELVRVAQRLQDAHPLDFTGIRIKFDAPELYGPPIFTLLSSCPRAAALLEDTMKKVDCLTDSLKFMLSPLVINNSATKDETCRG